jgi:hypothetical protein
MVGRATWDRMREALGGQRRRWRAVSPPLGALPGMSYVLLRDCTDPIPITLAGDEFEPEPEPPPPVLAVPWRRSTYWQPGGAIDWGRPPAPTRWDWRPVGEPHPLGPDPEHDPRRPPLTRS